MAATERLVTPERAEEDSLEASLRPKRLSEFVGQQQARENLSIFISAAKARGEALDHLALAVRQRSTIPVETGCPASRL